MAAQEKAAGVLVTPEAALKGSRAPIISGTPDADKIVAGIKARFALLGHEVYELADGGFIVSRWGLTKHCPDVCALGAFLKQIGGAA